MFQQKALHSSQLLVHESNRKSTDVFCTILGALFPLIMFITACAMWNKDNLQNKFFNQVGTANGQACKQGYSVLIRDFSNFNNNQCVLTCLRGWVPSQRLCVPQNDNQRQLFLSRPQISNPFDYYNFKKVLVWSSVISFSIGLLWMVFSFCCPKIVSIVAHVLGALVLTLLGIFTLALGDGFWLSNNGLRIFFAICCFIVALILIAMLCFWPNQRKFQGIMLDYAKIFVIQNCPVIFYFFIFQILALGLFALIIWQHCCFSSSVGTGSNFWNFANPGLLGLLNIFQLIWGLRFLRDAFNFCVSGYAADWYWHQPHIISCYLPFSRLICHHWGSVVGGSFLNAFFTVPTLIVELLICHPQACCSRVGTLCYNTCNKLFCFCDLVRTDSYSYMNMTGIPFCNSSRQTKKINQKCPSYVGYHSPMSHYRFAAHSFIIPLVTLISLFILGYRVVNTDVWHWIILIFLTYSITNWFINFLADAAEGLQTSYLAERQLQNGNYQKMNRLIPILKTPLQHMQRRVHGQGDGFL